MEFLKVSGWIINIIGVYAPTAAYPKKIKDEFWTTLEDELEKIKTWNEFFLMGDFNACIGREEKSLIVGQFVEDILNDNGQKWKEINEHYNMRISYTYLTIEIFINIHG